MTTENGLARFVALADGADVVIVGLDAAEIRRLSLGADHVFGRNPDVVYVALTGFGMDDDTLIPAHEPVAATALGAMFAMPAAHIGAKSNEVVDIL